MINMNYRSRELVEAAVFVYGQMCLLFLLYNYLGMGTLIRIRNVCLSYWKSGVVSFSRTLDEKSGYMVFPKFILKKMWSYVVFPGAILKKYVVILRKC